MTHTSIITTKFNLKKVHCPFFKLSSFLWVKAVNSHDHLNLMRNLPGEMFYLHKIPDHVDNFYQKDPLKQRFSNCGARQTGGNFPFYALYGNVRSNLPESGARPRTRLESDCAVCVCVCVCVCVFNTSSQFHFCIHGYK